MAELRPFLTQRLTGPRFSHTHVPLAVLQEFTAFNRLLQAAARHCFLLDNPERERVPRGFTQKNQLYLHRTIEPGSSTPTLVRHPRESLLPEHDYLQRGLEFVVSESQRMATSPSRAELPASIKNGFRQVGRSLQSGEAMQVLELGTGDLLTTFTPESRRAWLRNTSDTLHEGSTLAGRVCSIDENAGTFGLELHATGHIVRCTLDSDHFDAVFNALEFNFSQDLQIKGTVHQKDYPALPSSVSHIEELTQIPHLDMHSKPDRLQRLTALRAIADLSEDEESLISAAAFECAELLLNGLEEACLPAPSLFPLDEGGISVEWSQSPSLTSCDIRQDGSVLVHSLEVHGTPGVDFELSPPISIRDCLEAIYRGLSQ